MQRFYPEQQEANGPDDVSFSLLPRVTGELYEASFPAVIRLDVHYKSVIGGSTVVTGAKQAAREIDETSSIHMLVGIGGATGRRTNP